MTGSASASAGSYGSASVSAGSSGKSPTTAEDGRQGVDDREHANKSDPPMPKPIVESGNRIVSSMTREGKQIVKQIGSWPHN